MRGVSYEEFKENVRILEERGLLRKRKIFGYKKKTIGPVLLENGLGYFKNKAIFIVSKIDGKEYCQSNGSFQKHLIENQMEYFDYLKLCGVRVPIGYSLTMEGHGKEAKKNMLALENGEDSYSRYRSVLTSVSSDYKKLMLFYGMEEAEAKSVADRKHQKYSENNRGENNNSYGKRGINANCFKSFLKNSSPEEEFGKFLIEKNKKMILKWASDNDIDETSFETIKALYYYKKFKDLHRKKGKEIQEELNLDTIEQGIYIYNRRKSLACFNPKNNLDLYLKTIETCGNENDEENLIKFLLAEDYDGILSLFFSVKGFCGFSHGRIKHKTQKYGEFNLRSKLEKGVCFLLDNIDFVKMVSYEKIRIPYFDGVKTRTYVIDFNIELENGEKLLLEVKPYALCIIPDGIILQKKSAAEKWAKENGYNYLFITEKDMKYDLFRKKLQSF